MFVKYTLKMLKKKEPLRFKESTEIYHKGDIRYCWCSDLRYRSSGWAAGTAVLVSAEQVRLWRALVSLLCATLHSGEL